MFTIIHRRRTIAAVGAVVASLASTGVASAAIQATQPATGTSGAVTSPTVVAKYIDPNKVGSAGVPGYDTAACEILAKAHNSLELRGRRAARDGNVEDAEASFEAAGQEQALLEENCLVVD
jgi:hypothetical protein